MLLFAVVAQSVHGAPAPYQAPHAPATKSAYLKLPPGVVEPQGWLRDWCEVVRGGTLELDLGPQPNEAWAATAQPPPASSPQFQRQNAPRGVTDTPR